MRIPLQWLAEYVEIGDQSAEQIAARLNVTGTELEQVHQHGVETPDLVVVGRVLSAEQHPDADRLRVCKVATGEGDVAQIVCGAPNVKADQIVAIALVGTVMPGGMKIKKAKLRGQVSEGMICSARELGIGEEHNGILDLGETLPGAEDIVPGTPLSDVFVHSDQVLELEITPNRPDCLGLYGIAREVSAATGAELQPAPWLAAGSNTPDADGSAIDGFQIELTTAGCRRFTARLFDGVKIEPSPLWLQARVAQAGMRPISNVVDITNYVMHLTGQPLHAFDADHIAGGKLTVRDAKAGETIDTLDGKTRSLVDGELVIDDANGPTSLAAVMGGVRSEVQDSTTRVLLEVANWDGPTIHKTAQRLGLFSDAAGRNAKGLAPAQTMWAQALATQLLIEVCGATKVGGTIDVLGPEPIADPQPLTVREARVAKLLGVSVSRPRQTVLLTALGFEVSDPDPAAAEGTGTLSVIVPPERAGDVSREVDLIEEIARLGVIENLEPTLPARGKLKAATLTPLQSAKRRAEDVLVGRGLQEVMGWSFVAADAAGKLGLEADDPRAQAVALENPLSEDQAVLRPTVLLSLLDIASRIRSRGPQPIRIFECGTVFRDEPDPRRPELPFEHTGLCPLVEGDVLQAKGLLTAVMETLRIPNWEVVQEPAPVFLHPARSGLIKIDGEVVGLIGEVHPRVSDSWDLPQVSTFLLDLDKALPKAPENVIFKPVAAFPDSRFDLAVVVADTVPAAQVAAVAKKAGGALVEEASIFDSYSGKGIEPGQVSLALHVRLRAEDRTLEEVEITQSREAIVAALQTEVGGVLRG